MSPEWSYIIDADDVTESVEKITISAGKEEMARLVQRLGVLSFDSLSAELEHSRIDGGRVVYVQGRIRSVLRQECVRSMEPVKSQIDARFEAWFADPEQAIPLAKAKRERLTKNSVGEVPIVDERDDPEAIVDGKIDLGELVVQHLSLSLNPYPRAEDAEYEYGDDEPQKVPEAFRESPFAALKDWKRGD